MSLDGQLASTLLKSDTKAAEVPKSGESKHTGLVIDSRGLKAVPALAPRVLDEGGKDIYNSEFLEQSALEENGVVGYFRDLNAAKKHKRVGQNPLVLKAMKLGKGSKTDVVLSNADADKLRDPQANLVFLAKGRVAIVVD